MAQHIHFTLGNTVDRNSGFRGNLRSSVTGSIGLGNDNHHGIYTALGHRVCSGLPLNDAASDHHTNTITGS